MTPPFSLFLTILGMGLVTFLIRLLPILLVGRTQLPRWASQSLRYIPPAVLTAIIVPDLLLPGGVLDLSLTNGRLVAGSVAALVAWRSRNVLLTVAAGMGVLWGLQWLM